ncbi:MAG: hypothetical protein LIO79_10085 [Rikenellaceae bacterium]|nr:hypothetical protein [Rikenellaceae bacterium]
MKKFYLLYFILYALFSTVFIGCNLWENNVSYELWHAISHSDCLPVPFVLLIPAFISFTAGGLSMLIVRPKLRRYSEQDVIIDLSVIIITALAGWVSLRYVGWLEPFLEFRVVYNLLAVGSGALLGLNIALFRRAISKIPEKKPLADGGLEFTSGTQEKKPVALGSAFFSVTFVLSMVVLAIGIAAIHEGWNYGPGETVLLLCVLFGLAVVIAVGAYYLTERLWKRSVFGGLVLFVVFLLGFGLSGTAFVHQCFYFAYTNMNDFGILGEYTGDMEDNEYYDDYYDDYYEEDDDYYEDGGESITSESLEGICDEDENEYTLFDSALEYLSNEVETDRFPRWVPWQLYTFNEGFSHLLDYGGNAFRRIASYLFHNSPEVVMHMLVDRYSHNIEKMVSRDDYEKKYRRIVDLLLVAYDDLFVEDDDTEYYGTQLMLSVYRTMQRECPGGYDDWTEFYYGFIERNHAFPDLLYKFRFESGEVDHRMVVWVYSFWGRRANESVFNPQDIYQALVKIRSIYEEDEEMEYDMSSTWSM